MPSSESSQARASIAELSAIPTFESRQSGGGTALLAAIPAIVSALAGAVANVARADGEASELPVREPRASEGCREEHRDSGREESSEEYRGVRRGQLAAFDAHREELAAAPSASSRTQEGESTRRDRREDRRSGREA